jgi:hypothetical protein
MDIEVLKAKLRYVLEELTQNRKDAAHQYEVGGLGKSKLGAVAWEAVEYIIDDTGEDLALALHMETCGGTTAPLKLPAHYRRSPY